MTSVVKYKLVGWKASFIDYYPWHCYLSENIRGWLRTAWCLGTLLNHGLPTEPHFLSATVLKNNTVKVETEAEDAALDCSVNSRSSEKHPLDGVFTALQDSSKRKPLGGEAPLDSVPSVKRRRLIPEVRPSWESRNLLTARTVNESLLHFT